MPPNPDKSKTAWIIHAQVVQLSDGSLLIKPQKPRLRAPAKLTSRLTGISLKNLRILSGSGLIRCAKPSLGTCFCYPLEIEDFIQQPEADPAFWSKVRRATYLEFARLRNGTPPKT